MIGLTIAGTRPAGTRGTHLDDKCAAEHDSETMNHINDIF